MSCAPNTPILWNHIYTIGQKADQARADLSVASEVSSMADTNPLFSADGFQAAEIEYYWHFDPETVVEPCEEIIDHGFEIVNQASFRSAEYYAFEEDRLYFIGAVPGSGVNANNDCFCCVTGKVVAESTEHSYNLQSIPESSCHTSPAWDNPCPDFFEFNVSVELDEDRQEGLEEDGVWKLKYKLCANSPKYYTAAYRWIVLDEESGWGVYRLDYISIPLSGFFGWDIRKTEFEDLISQMRDIIAASCGAKYQKVKEASKDKYIFTGCPFELEDYVWSNKGVEDPGCIELNDSTSYPQVNFPWVSPTCEGDSCDDKGPKVYCNTVTRLEQLFDDLKDYAIEKTPNCDNEETVGTFEVLFSFDHDCNCAAFDCTYSLAGPDMQFGAGKQLAVDVSGTGLITDGPKSLDVSKTFRYIKFEFTCDSSTRDNGGVKCAESFSSTNGCHERIGLDEGMDLDFIVDGVLFKQVYGVSTSSPVIIDICERTI